MGRRSPSRASSKYFLDTVSRVEAGGKAHLNVPPVQTDEVVILSVRKVLHSAHVAEYYRHLERINSFSYKFKRVLKYWPTYARALVVALFWGGGS